MTELCPTPWKIVYVSRRNAHTDVKRHNQKQGVQLKPYKCPCGHWHVSRLSKRQAKHARQGKRVA